MTGKALWRLLAAVLDLTVVPSFGSPGFVARSKTWSPEALTEDLRGRVYLVTGANSGIGLAATRALAARGATVHMVCRNAQRGHSAAEELRGSLGAASLVVHELDLSNLGAVRSCCARDLTRLPRLDGVAHNAGALVHDRRLTPEGLELTFATHVAGPFLMNGLLWQRLRQWRTRVIWVSSGGMYTQRLRVGDIRTGGAEPFNGVAAYAQCKRAQVILTHRLAARAPSGEARFASMHPGWADTTGLRASLPAFRRITRRLLRTADQAADTLLWLLISEEASCLRGELYFDRLRRREHLPFGNTRSTEHDVDSLWRLCLECTNLPTDAFA